MKILITGSRGFIGSYFAPELRTVGFEVVGIDFEHGDLARDNTTIFDWLDRVKPDIVVHLAAQVSRVLSEYNPGHTVRSNAAATAYLAQECSKRGVKLVY